MKPKTCKCGCGQKFTPTRPMQPTTDDFECRARYAIKVAEKRRKNREKEERKSIRERKEKLKTRRDYMKEAQIAFNAYIRERDKDKPCICCGKQLQGDQTLIGGELYGPVGGGFDCGHYRSVGSAPHLRFDERNAHGQRKQCNRYGAGRAVDYRLGLIRRMGLEVVESIESDQEPKHYTIEDLIQIKETYKQKLKELKANQ